MRAEFLEIPKPSPGPTGLGVAIKVSDFREKSVQFNLSAGSVTLEGSNDGSVWNDVGGGAKTANALVSVAFTLKFLRLNVATDIGAGKAIFAGMNSRTD